MTSDFIADMAHPLASPGPFKPMRWIADRRDAGQGQGSI
jgi:hypothetical protein